MFWYIMYEITFDLFVRKKYNAIFSVVQKYVDTNLNTFSILTNVMLNYKCLKSFMKPRFNHLIELTIPLTQLLMKDVHFKQEVNFRGILIPSTKNLLILPC